MFKLVQCVNQSTLKNGKIALQVLKVRNPEVWDPKRQVFIYNPEEQLQIIHEMIYEGKCPWELHQDMKNDSQ